MSEREPSWSNRHHQITKAIFEANKWSLHLVFRKPTNHCLYDTEFSMYNIRKTYQPKNKHVNPNVRTFQYMSPIFFFFFLYSGMVHEGTQNIQTIKRELQPMP